MFLRKHFRGKMKEHFPIKIQTLHRGKESFKFIFSFLFLFFWERYIQVRYIHIQQHHKRQNALRYINHSEVLLEYSPVTFRSDLITVYNSFGIFEKKKKKFQWTTKTRWIIALWWLRHSKPEQFIHGTQKSDLFLQKNLYFSTDETKHRNGDDEATWFEFVASVWNEISTNAQAIPYRFHDL